MAGHVSWKTADAQATLTCGPLRASLAILAPAQGLVDVSIEGAPLAGSRFLGLDLDVERQSVTDFYQRGGDLIVRFAETRERPFAVMAYWRAGLLELAGATYPYVDLIVSVETSRLDSRPSLAARSFLSIASEEIKRGPQGWGGRFAGVPIAYAEFCHPDDAIAPAITASGDGWQSATPLFGQPLEKGVILRSRLRGVWMPQEGNERTTQAALAAFAAAPPPLTT